MLGNFLANQRMQQLLQPLALAGILEHPRPQHRAIQLACRRQHAIAKMLGDPRQGGFSGLHHPARRMVGVDPMHAEPAELLDYCALATADTAGQPENPRFHHLTIAAKRRAVVTP